MNKQLNSKNPAPTRPTMKLNKKQIRANTSKPKLVIKKEATEQLSQKEADLTQKKEFIKQETEKFVELFTKEFREDVAKRVKKIEEKIIKQILKLYQSKKKKKK